MKESCIICGGNEIVCLDKVAKKYRCKSCDEIFVLDDKPKVVERVVEKIVEVPANKDGLTPAEIYKSAIDSVFELSCEFGDESSSGTGFYISTDGYLITNSHVLLNRKSNGKFVLCQEVYACKSGDVDYDELDMIYLDTKNDLALLRIIDKESVKPLKLATQPLEIGESVVAIGNSKGEGLSIVNGIVSDTNRKFMGHPAFLFNALVANGCSGGPIFNSRGEVCGVIVGARDDAEGMKYGIPIEVLCQFIKRVENEKEMKIKLL